MSTQPSRFTNTGVILFVRKYIDCISFYKKVIGLEIMFQEEGDYPLTCFKLGDAYLMLECLESEKIQTKDDFKIRFNVNNIDSFSEQLNEKGVEHKVLRYDWGNVINICDPEGNEISIRDEAGFVKQIERYLNAAKI
jgi:lactoylglutathione lyase